MLPKHITIARESGIDAGFEAWKSTPVTRLHPQYALVMSCKGASAQRKAYAKLYKEQIGTIKRVKPNEKAEVAHDIAEAMTAQPDALNTLVTLLQELIAKQQGVVETVVDDTQGRKVGTGVITMYDAWVALGRKAAYKRNSSKNRPATPAQLWLINEAEGFERVYSAGDTWKALGSPRGQANGEPNDKTRNASGRALAAVNRKGLLRFA